MAQDDSFMQMKWLDPCENLFGIRVLDCRPFSATMISSTKDPNIVAHFMRLRTATGQEHRGQHPADPLTVECYLRYPFNGESKDGPLFVARQMEEKWDIYLYDSMLFFARSWTGHLLLRAAIVFKEKEAVIATVEASRANVMDDPALAVRKVDFLMKTHLYRKEAPHPFPHGIPDDKKTLAMYSFSEYGRWAFYGSFEDTTKVDVFREK
jgi:hypothetical protein